MKKISRIFLFFLITVDTVYVLPRIDERWFSILTSVILLLFLISEMNEIMKIRKKEVKK